MIYDVVTILAISLEILGALMLANHYLRVKVISVPRILFSALLRTRLAKDVSVMAKLASDDPLISLRGLAFLTLGFALQFAALFVKQILTVF